MNICAKPNICASNSASSQSPKPLAEMLHSELVLILKFKL